MNPIEMLEQQHAIGSSTLKEIFGHSKEAIIRALGKIFYDNEDVMEILNNNPVMTRVYEDDKPNRITFSFYSHIHIDWRGVSYQPEHGPGKLIQKFNQFFNITPAFES